MHNPIIQQVESVTENTVVYPGVTWNWDKFDVSPNAVAKHKGKRCFVVFVNADAGLKFTEQWPPSNYIELPKRVFYDSALAWARLIGGILVVVNGDGSDADK